MGNLRKRLEKNRMQKLDPGVELDRIIDKHSTSSIGGPERSIMPVPVKTSFSKSEISDYVRRRCLNSTLVTMSTKPDGIDRAPEKSDERITMPPYRKIIERIVEEGKKKNQVA